MVQHGSEKVLETTACGTPHTFMGIASRNLTWFSQWIAEKDPLVPLAGDGEEYSL